MRDISRRVREDKIQRAPSFSGCGVYRSTQAGQTLPVSFSDTHNIATSRSTNDAAGDHACVRRVIERRKPLLSLAKRPLHECPLAGQ